MKKSVYIVFLFVLAGCAGGHYYQEEKGTVTIFLNGINADQVFFASSLDGYNPHRAIKTDDDTWEIRVPAPNEFKYFYIVDGDVYIPACRIREKDDFGSENCIYVPGM